MTATTRRCPSVPWRRTRDGCASRRGPQAAGSPSARRRARAPTPHAVRVPGSETRSRLAGRYGHEVDPSEGDRVELEHAPKAIVCVSGRDLGDRKRGYRHRARRRDSPSHAAFYRRDLDWPSTGKHLHQRRRREYHYAHPLACLEACLRLRSGDERHPRVCARLREWFRDPGAYHDHYVSPRVRALDEARRDPARPEIHRSLWRDFLAAQCAVGAARSPHEGR